MTSSAPVPNASPPSAPVDVAIVGAGAAGIAAARRCLAMGLTVSVIEARARVGGRATTTLFGGHPVDLGAHWLHAGAVNPLVKLGARRGERLRRAPSDGPLVIDGRLASRGERRMHGAAFEAADRAFATAAREADDRSLAAAFPGLGRWRASITATMSLISGRPVDEVSAKDFPSDEFGDNHFIAGGYGAYLSRLARGLPIALRSPVRRVDWSGPGVALSTDAGTVRARAAILTVPMPVLQQGAITFTPELPAATRAAVSGFLAGTYEHVVLNWPDAPFRRPDRLTKITGRGGSYGMLTHMDGAPFHYLELDHETATRFDGRDRHALVRFARRFLIDTFGAKRTRTVRSLCVTDWRRDPWSLCSWAVVPPGAVAIRGEISMPVGERVWFAGEANSSAMWGTAGGAWEEGERAAAEIAERLARSDAARPKVVPSGGETP